MGTYAAVSDVQAEFKSLSAGSTNPISDTDVTSFITQVEAWLEGEIAGIYSVPITGTKSIAIMKYMTILQVKARIMDILPVKVGNPLPNQGNPATELKEQVKAMLENIKKKTMLLVDATLANTTGGVQSYAVENSLEHINKNEEDQW
jgi:hypothetical protein